jgi:hypothetical protein
MTRTLSFKNLLKICKLIRRQHNASHRTWYIGILVNQQIGTLYSLLRPNLERRNRESITLNTLCPREVNRSNLNLIVSKRRIASIGRGTNAPTLLVVPANLLILPQARSSHPATNMPPFPVIQHNPPLIQSRRIVQLHRKYKKWQFWHYFSRAELDLLFD